MELPKHAGIYGSRGVTGTGVSNDTPLGRARKLEEPLQQGTPGPHGRNEGRAMEPERKAPALPE